MGPFHIDFSGQSDQQSHPLGGRMEEVGRSRPEEGEGLARPTR